MYVIMFAVNKKERKVFTFWKFTEGLTTGGVLTQKSKHLQLRKFSYVTINVMVIVKLPLPIL